MTGPVTVRLWAVSSAADTDFVARLIDVHPDGSAYNLTDGIIRARFRNSSKGEKPSLIEPGKAYLYEIDLWATSNVFKKGTASAWISQAAVFPAGTGISTTGLISEADARKMPVQQGRPSFMTEIILLQSFSLSYRESDSLKKLQRMIALKFF